MKNQLNERQIEWLNNYCKERSEGDPFFMTNAGNLEFIYNELNKLEEN